MTAETVLIWFLAGMVLAIGLGNKLKVNIGLIAMVFGYFLAVFGLGMKASEYVNLFPTKITFTIIGICWLFGYANENGSLKEITLLLVYKFKNLPSILPWVFFFISGVICMTGASPYAPNAVLMPIIISVCLATDVNPLAWCPDGQYGRIHRGSGSVGAGCQYPERCSGNQPLCGSD